MKTLFASVVVVVIAFLATALFADEKKTLAVTVDAAQRETLIADPDHSSVEFRTRHWQIVDLIGWFEDFDIEVEVTDGNFGNASVVGRIRPASARMPNMDMAGNLRGMFDVERYPEVVFRSSVVERTGDNTYHLSGKLDIKGISRDLTWDVVFNGFGLPPGTMPGFTAKAQIDIRKFGFDDKLLFPPDGPPTVGEVVFITCNIRLIRPSGD